MAREAGVSRGLVSLAMSGSPNVAADTRERIMQAAQKLGYTRNLGVAMLAAKASPIVGIALPNLENPFFESIVTAIQHVADTRGMLALTATASFSAERERKVIESFQSLRANGLIIVSPTLDNSALAELSQDIPLCIVGAPSSGGSSMSVHIDETYAIHLAINHLLDCSFEQLAFFSVPPEAAADSASKERVAAYKKACKEYGLQPRVVRAQTLISAAKKI
ncbi:LacI family DNA-binding transcriptional regulator [uncultured Actinomyces sp.]|uniref:LacI family DNA-binding transcriptional regulator n=1 Tax=uncultured Actinomyces sp. TaxID=249061 RepID=UPI00261A559A|nr:LacI family DNA-binding transcriptional regulator [uncultured Actinomyces sp.]